MSLAIAISIIILSTLLAIGVFRQTFYDIDPEFHAFTVLACRLSVLVMVANALLWAAIAYEIFI